MSIKRHQRHLLDAPTKPLSRIDDIEDDSYQIERDGNEIEFKLGMAPTFRLPVQTAIKLALIILRKCGVEVDHG